MEKRKPSTAYYGVEVTHYSEDSSIEQFARMLAFKLMPHPKQYALVKTFFKCEYLKFDTTHMYNIVFTTLVAEDEYLDFIKVFEELTVTSFNGLEI